MPLPLLGSSPTFIFRCSICFPKISCNTKAGSDPSPHHHTHHRLLIEREGSKETGSPVSHPLSWWQVELVCNQNAASRARGARRASLEPGASGSQGRQTGGLVLLSASSRGSLLHSLWVRFSSAPKDSVTYLHILLINVFLLSQPESVSVFCNYDSCSAKVIQKLYFGLHKETYRRIEFSVQYTCITIWIIEKFTEYLRTAHKLSCFS